MNGIKNILASRTFWGGLLAIVAGLLGLFGFEFSGADQATAVDYVAGVGAMAGGFIAIIGRIIASKKIG